MTLCLLSDFASTAKNATCDTRTATKLPPERAVSWSHIVYLGKQFVDECNDRSQCERIEQTMIPRCQQWFRAGGSDRDQFETMTGFM